MNIAQIWILKLTNFRLKKFNRNAKRKMENSSRNYRIDNSQLSILKRCSKKRDITEWNSWRETNPEQEILLEGADLEGLYLRNANFNHALLNYAMINDSDLEDASFYSAKLMGAGLNFSNFKNTCFNDAIMTGSVSNMGEFEGAQFLGTNLFSAEMENANFKKAHIQSANLGNAIFWDSVLDCESIIRNCDFDENTDFSGVGLDIARIPPRLNESFKGIIRKKQWEEWYDEGILITRLVKKLFIKPFWWLTNYGRSSLRIICTFIALAAFFASAYYILGVLKPPGVIENLFKLNGVNIDPKFVPIRAFYFSIVAMTTLGFGDMYAMPECYIGYTLLMTQVIIGYVLLGALVTRLAVLFTGLGPLESRKKKHRGIGRINRMLRR